MMQQTQTAVFQLKPGMHLHIVGIGGAGMSAIARVLLGQGFVVSGSDMAGGEKTAVLQQQGATVHIGHEASHIAGAGAVVISSAIGESNPEVAAARAAGVPVLKRADFLGHLMADRVGIAVAGSHGKTTTTGMIAQILLEADLDPTVIVGGDLPLLGGNGRSGDGAYFVVEADEYDRMFLGLRPEIGVITNIEHDHPDIYPTATDYWQAFADFAGLLPENGRLIVCGDDSGVAHLLRGLDLPNVEITSYGIQESEQNPSRYQFQALDCRPNALGGTDFLVEQDGQVLGMVRLQLPGLHNVRNALAAIIVGTDLEIEFDLICQALLAFGGVGRRFQLVGEANGVTIIDDYAHHSTEIRATLAAARQRYAGRRLWAVWQPHTFSRTKLLLKAFRRSFADADQVVALDIYRSREQETLGMDTAKVVAKMRHPSVVHIGEKETAVSYLLQHTKPGDVVLTLGAGDGNLVGVWLLEKLLSVIGNQ
ncbi:MAG: UDP-N-acetylmuramate--L-alanine ligase [Anaerolineales bacterium]|nr:UDP-N-acetylmuramate--L-alanine ligase [Anaerolineales bacterium]